MKAKNLVGKTYGWLSVEAREGSIRNRANWRCRCKCGNITYTTTEDLEQGKRTSCGCIKKEIGTRKRLDEVGKIYNYLLVEECIGSKDRKALFRCKCLRCGKETTATGKALRSGTKKSCGCLKREYMENIGNKTFHDLTGMTFGYLLVESRAQTKYSKKGTPSTMWNCRCLLCGNSKTVAATALTSNNHTRSCGCLKMSYAEKDICDELTRFHIDYIHDYSFCDLLSPTSGFPLRFDFALFDTDNKLLSIIEYQGPQHYQRFAGGFGDFQREVTDPIKKDYCQKNHIPLFEIRYDEDLLPTLHHILNQMNYTSHDNSVPSSEQSEKV